MAHHSAMNAKGIMFPVADAGPSTEVLAINKAIGAESAFTLQCRSMVQQYVPQIIDIINKMPLDQVGQVGFSGLVAIMT